MDTKIKRVGDRGPCAFLPDILLAPCGGGCAKILKWMLLTAPTLCMALDARRFAHLARDDHTRDFRLRRITAGAYIDCHGRFLHALTARRIALNTCARD